MRETAPGCMGVAWDPAQYGRFGGERLRLRHLPGLHADAAAWLALEREINAAAWTGE